MLADLDQAPVAPPGMIPVPVIDLAAGHERIVPSIADACSRVGFFQVVNHGLDPARVEKVRAVARAFFAQDREAKRQYVRSRDNPWGYYDRELTKEQRDRKEIFDIGPDAGDGGYGGEGPFAGSTPWPVVPADFRAVMTGWSNEMTALGLRLAGYIGEGLGDATALLDAFWRGHTSYLRLNHYPLSDELAPELGGPADLGIHHHTDAGALTVLLQDSVAGLQVHRDGFWHNVDPIPGALTINIGDMVQIWSNDLYLAPVHRVLAMDKSERTSLAYFLNPGYDREIAPLCGPARYRPLNWGDYRRRRADGDFASYGTEVQISDWRVG